MKHLAGIYKTLGVLVFVSFLIPYSAFADTYVDNSNNGDGSTSNVSVNSQVLGQSTICHNGVCTTTGGGGKTTVCYNGQCTTTDNGNFDYQSKDGHTQIHVHNNTSGNTVTGEPTASSSPEPTVSTEPTLTPDPTIMQMRKEINNKVRQETEGIKEHMKDQGAAIASFVQSEITALQHFLNGLFK